jgi:hypothetical protein
VLWSVGLLVSFRELLGEEPGRFRAAVTGAAYTAYLIHPVAVFGLTKALTEQWWGVGGTLDLLIHVLVLSPLVVVLTWGPSMLIKLIPGTEKIL